MVARPAEATKASSFAVLARRNNQNRMAIGVGMVTHALRAGLTLLRSADSAQVAALGNQGHRRQSRHIYGATLTRSSPHRRCLLHDANRLSSTPCSRLAGVRCPLLTQSDIKRPRPLHCRVAAEWLRRTRCRDHSAAWLR